MNEWIKSREKEIYIRPSREMNLSPTTSVEISSLLVQWITHHPRARIEGSFQRSFRAAEDRNFFVSLNGAENQASDIVDEELKLLEISLTQKREDATRRGVARWGERLPLGINL